jgi:hypothetical protein
MSTPESSSSKGRPSLLSDTAPGAVDSHSRILASLEGRVVAQQAPRKRSKKPLIAAALAVIGVGALGAWQWQHGQRSEATIVAAAPAAAKTPGASAAVNPTASGTVADVRVAEGASAPQAAVIVADDTTRAAPALASSSAAGDADLLSRALTDGAAPGQAAAQAANIPASAPVVAAASAPSSALAKQAPANKRLASRPERESAKNRRTEKLAAAHASKHDKRRARPAKDDPDADLLAALVARTKPYDAKAPMPASAAAAAKAAQPGGKAQTASLSDQLKACAKGNFFEAQACHWRVCSGHWGKDTACPSAAPASTTQSNG